MRIIVASLLVALVAGCGGIKLPFSGNRDKAPVAIGDASQEGVIRPRARPGKLGGQVPDGARTVEDFDTTTSAERNAAQQDTSGGRKLGVTIASLGSPTEPGFWLKTPLVSQTKPGRVVYPISAKSVQVTLQPIDGPASAGSRMSLAALRLLGAPLTGLLEVEVYSE